MEGFFFTLSTHVLPTKSFNFK